MSKTSNTNNGTFFAWANIAFEWSINRDACAEQRRDFMQFVMKSLGDFESPVVVDLDVSAISTELLSIQINPILAHLSAFFLVFAVSASEVRVSNWTDCHKVTNF